MRSTIAASGLLTLVFAVAPLALPAQQQAGAPAASGRIELTSGSDVAKTEYRQLIIEFANLRGRVAREHALKALAGDPNFGLARVYLATAGLSPQLSADERVAEMNRAIAAMSSSSAPELLLAVALREGAAGRAPVSQAIIKTLAQLAPNEPLYAFTVFGNERTGKPLEQILREERELIQKFPDWAAGYNTYAYDLHASGDHEGEITAIREYVRRAPTQPNAHDTWSDLLIMHDRLADAESHTQAALRLDSMWAQGYAKIGTIRLAEGKVPEARALFARYGEVGGTTATKLDAHYWLAATYIYDHDAKSGLRELAAIGDEAVALRGTAAQRALPYQRLAVIEAVAGDKKNVAPNLARAAAVTGASALTQSLFATMANGFAGDAAAAQASADAYAAATGANAATGHTLKAIAAIAAKNYALADTELNQSAPTDVLARALRAEVLKQQGKTAEAKVIKDEVLKLLIKLPNNAPLDFNRLVARLRVEKI